MEIKDLELVTKSDDGLVKLSEEVELWLDYYEFFKQQVEEKEVEFRSSLLNAMIDNNIVKQDIGKWNVMQVVHKDTVVFDSDKFITEENEDLVKLVTDIDEEDSIDFDKLIEENPELIQKYTTKNYKYTVNEKKLKKLFPEIYNKYTSIFASTTPTTLRISKKKQVK